MEQDSPPSAAVSNSGLVEVGTLSTLSTGPYSQTAGTTIVNGTLNLGGGSVTISGGTLDGNGKVIANVFNSGNVAPGNSPGLLTITGDYAQTSSGVLDIEIGGTTPGTQYDVLDVNGIATLGGTLDVTLLNSFDPPVGSSYVILDPSSINSVFATLDLPSLGPTKAFDVQYNATNVTLTVAAVPEPAALGLLARPGCF